MPNRITHRAGAFVTHPNVPKDGAVGALAVSLKVLGHNGRDGHGNSDEAVVVDADPDDVEPRQAALGRAPGAPVAAAALCEPVEGPNPGLHGAHLAEEVLLRMQVRGDIVTDEGEEGGDGKGLVAVRDDLEVDGVPVPLDLEVSRDGVNGDHKEDADDAAAVPCQRPGR